LNNQLLEIKKSHPKYVGLPFIYWFFWFCFAFNSILYTIALIKNLKILEGAGIFIITFAFSMTILMWWYAAFRNSKNKKNEEEQQLVKWKIDDEEANFTKGKLATFEEYYLENRKDT